jgi:hypothetical protein
MRQEAAEKLPQALTIHQHLPLASLGDGSKTMSL